MHYDPRTEQPTHAPVTLEHCTGPRAVAWLSTVDATGRANLHAVTNWQWLAGQQSTLMFSVPPQLDGARPRVVSNTEETGWLVLNTATWAMRDAVDRSAFEPLDGLDAFEHAQVGKAPCVNAPGPRVAQSPLQLECRHLSTLRLPQKAPGQFVDLVFVEVARAHLQEDEWDAQKQRLKPRLLYAQNGAYCSTPARDTSRPTDS